MRWMISMLLVALLAGCSDDNGSKGEVEAEPEKFKDVEVDKDKGVIRGVVIDQTIMPIAGATIVLVGQGQSTESDADGAFLFLDLDPGSYFLEASAPGFETIQSSTDVAAGVADPDVVKVLLTAGGERLPYADTVPFNGYIQCAVGTVAAGLEWRACQSLGELGTSASSFSMEFKAGMTSTQTEIYWEGTNTLGDGLLVGHVVPGSLNRYAGANGASPLSLRVSGETVLSNVGDAEAIPIVVTASTSDVSIVLEQPFTAFHTNFYGIEPAEDWLYGVNGPARAA